MKEKYLYCEQYPICGYVSHQVFYKGEKFCQICKSPLITLENLNKTLMKVKPLSPLNQGRLNKLLDREFLLHGEITSFRKLIPSVTSKSLYRREYEQHRKQLEYRKMQHAKIEYSLIIKKDIIFAKVSYYLDCPKLIWDFFKVPILK